MTLRMTVMKMRANQRIMLMTMSRVRIGFDLENAVNRLDVNEAVVNVES